ARGARRRCLFAPASRRRAEARDGPGRPIGRHMKAFVLCFALLAATVCHAQSWPQKPVRVIVPFAPGGASDLMPRLVGEKLGSMWAQPVVIENRPGAAGNIGMEAGARAAADGYTLLAAPNGNLVVNPHMYSKLAYDVLRDL